MRTAILLALTLATANAAFADEIPPKARALAQEGQRAHAAGNYAKAVDAFERAYVLAPSSNLLFNLAQAYRLAGDCENALIMYRRFLEASPSAQAATITGVHMRSMERCLHPEAAPVVTAPRAAGTRTTVAGGPSQLVAAPPAPRTHTRLTTGLALAGVAALGVSLVYGLDAQSASNDVEARYARGASWRDIAATQARGQHDSRMGLAFGIGGVLAVGGAVGLHLYDRHTAERATISVAQPSRGTGATVSVAWQF